jgi:hypothetical protein
MLSFVYSDELHHEGDGVEMGRAMRRLGVTFGESLDSQRLLHFYCEAPEVYLLGPIPPPLFDFDVIKPQTVNGSSDRGFVHAFIIRPSTVKACNGHGNLGFPRFPWESQGTGNRRAQSSGMRAGKLGKRLSVMEMSSSAASHYAPNSVLSSLTSLVRACYMYWHLYRSAM